MNDANTCMTSVWASVFMQVLDTLIQIFFFFFGIFIGRQNVIGYNIAILIKSSFRKKKTFALHFLTSRLTETLSAPESRCFAWLADIFHIRSAIFCCGLVFPTDLFACNHIL